MEKCYKIQCLPQCVSLPSEILVSQVLTPLVFHWCLQIDVFVFSSKFSNCSWWEYSSSYSTHLEMETFIILFLFVIIFSALKFPFGSSLYLLFLCWALLCFSFLSRVFIIAHLNNFYDIGFFKNPGQIIPISMPLWCCLFWLSFLIQLEIFLVLGIKLFFIVFRWC